MGENTVQNPKIRNSRTTSFLEIGTRRGIASNRDVTATIPVSRIGSRDCPRGNEPLAPRNRCLAPDLRPCFLHAASLLVRHFERIVARNKLITIVIEIFLVHPPPWFIYRPVWIMETSSPAFYLLTLFVRWICATRCASVAGDNRVVLFAFYHALLSRRSKGNERIFILMELVLVWIVEKISIPLLWNKYLILCYKGY